MQRDLKILFWLLFVALVILVVYAIVDYTFDLLDNPQSYQYFKSIKTFYTNNPTESDPDTPSDKNWKPKRESLPFLGYAHVSVIFMITGILVTTFIGFLIIYMSNRKG